MSPVPFDLFTLVVMAAYTLVLIFVADTVTHLPRARIPLLRSTLTAFLALLTVGCLAQLVVQFGHFMHGANRATEAPFILLWALFDLTTAAALLAYVGSVRVYLTWQPPPCPDAPPACPRRHGPRLFPT